MPNNSERLYLHEDANLRKIVHRMEEDPNYRPRGYAEGEEGLEEAREDLKDVREVLRDIDSEGNS